MNIVARHFGKLFLLAVVGGLIVGVVLARRGIDIDLGTYGGINLTLAAPPTTPTPLVPPELFATPAAPAGAARP